MSLRGYTTIYLQKLDSANGMLKVSLYEIMCIRVGETQQLCMYVRCKYVHLSRFAYVLIYTLGM